MAHLPNMFAEFFINKVNSKRSGFDSLSSSGDWLICKILFKQDCLTSFNPVTDDFVCKLITCNKPTTCDLDSLPTSLLVDSRF